MAEYHVGCGLAGIYAGTLKPKKKDEWLNKSDVTDEAVESVRDWLYTRYKNDGTYGYAWGRKDGGRVELTIKIYPPEQLNNELSESPEN